MLLATVLLVIGYGLYELFVDSSVQLPAWLEIRSLDDLKNKLIGVVVAIIAVVFLGILVDLTDPSDVLYVGAGAGAVVFGLAAFIFASNKRYVDKWLPPHLRRVGSPTQMTIIPSVTSNAYVHWPPKVPTSVAKPA